jgi:hypothetical protein
MSENWRKYALEFFAVLTVLLDGGHLAHLWSVEWLTVLSALVTAILATLNLVPAHPETAIPTGTPPKNPPPTPPKKG